MAFGNDLTINIKAKDEASNTLNKIKGNIKAHSAAFERAGKRMLIASAALTAGLGVAINQAAKFQQQMAQVSTMLDETSMKNMPVFEKAIKRMSIEFGEGTGTLADGLYNILSASIPAEKAISVLDASVRAAKAGLTDTGTAADAITTIINAYGLSADKAADVSDLLFAIVKRGKLTFAELAPNIGKVAAMAAKSGMNLESLGATIATLTRSGVRSEIAMTAVRGILNGMLKPGNEAAKVFKEKLGVAMDTTTLKAEGVVGVLTRMKNAGLKPEEISKMFPNVRALVGVVAAMGDLKGITHDYNLMVNRAGLSTEAFNKNINTSEVTLKKLKSSLNVAAIALGKQLLPYVDKALESITELLKRFGGLSEGSQKIVAVSLALSAAFLGIGGAMLIVITKIPAMIVGYQAIAAGLVTLAAKAEIATGALTLGLGAAIAFTGLKLTKLVIQTREYIQALKDQAEASMSASELQAQAFSKTLMKFSELKDKFSTMGPEYIKQIEIIEELRDNYEKLGSTGKTSAEDQIAVQNVIIEKIQEMMSWERAKLEQKQEIAEEEKAIEDEKGEKQDLIKEKDIEAYRQLVNEKELLDIKSLKNKNKRLNAEKKLKIQNMKKDITSETLRKAALLKIEQIYSKKSSILAKQLAAEKRTAALNIASTTISTLKTILEAEGSSAKKKKGFIIALMTAELALGITRMWTAESTKGVFGIASAAAGTAALVANYGAQMHRITSAKSDTNIGGDLSNIDVGGTGIGNAEGAAGKIGTVQDTSFDSGGVPSSSGGFTGGGGGGNTGVGGGTTGEVSKVTNINVGGIDVNLGGIDIKEENLETVLRDIGEAVKSKTVEAVTMAMRIYNVGKDNQGEAV